MAKISTLKDIEYQKNTVVTVGTFDGIHGGHRVLMETVIKKAKTRNARSVVITFDPHPREIINPGKSGIKLLTTLQERAEVLADIGIDVLLVIPFDRDFSLLTSEEFVKDVIYKHVGISEFVIGYDHHFGRDREGSIETVERLGKELGYDSYVVSKQEMGNTTISSTEIRKQIQVIGDVEKAAQLLGRKYFLNATVVHGDKRGRHIGFPTANLSPEHPNKTIPKTGVYAVKVKVNGELKSGMMNIGIRPTFESDELRLEVHIFDFNEDIYGKKIQVTFINRIRDEKKFSGIEELKAQLELDKIAALKELSNQ